MYGGCCVAAGDVLSFWGVAGERPSRAGLAGVAAVPGAPIQGSSFLENTPISTIDCGHKGEGTSALISTPNLVRWGVPVMLVPSQVYGLD